MLILHYTGMQGRAGGARPRCATRRRKVSSHYVVDEDGADSRLVPEERRALHAGISYWRGATELNGRSIGIEIVNPGHDGAIASSPCCRWPPCAICASRSFRAIRSRRATSSAQRRRPGPQGGPGRAVRLGAAGQERRRALAGGVPDLGTGGHRARRRRTCATCAARSPTSATGSRPEGALDPALATVLRAFQRHWRPEAVTGQADSGTLARLLAWRGCARGEVDGAARTDFGCSADRRIRGDALSFRARSASRRMSEARCLGRISRRARDSDSPRRLDYRRNRAPDGETAPAFDAVARRQGRIFEALDDAIAARFALMLGQLGNLRTQTLKAFPEQAYREIIATLG